MPETSDAPDTTAQPRREPRHRPQPHRETAHRRARRPGRLNRETRDPPDSRPDPPTRPRPPLRTPSADGDQTSQDISTALGPGIQAVNLVGYLLGARVITQEWMLLPLIWPPATGRGDGSGPCLGV